jgi:hypothetical protein
MIELTIDFSSNEKKEKLWKILKTLKPKKYEISIKQYRENRSMPQLRYYWGVVLSILSNETGFTPEELHEVLKLKFNTQTKVIKHTGEEVFFGGSTGDLDTMQFEDYLEKIKTWAIQEINTYIPDPNQEPI